MPAKPRSAVELYEYRALLVGIRIATGAVVRVWVRNDGGMTDGGPVHYPTAGRTTAGDAIVVFGLTKFREFPTSDLVAAGMYAAMLQSELDGDNPAAEEP